MILDGRAENDGSDAVELFGRSVEVFNRDGVGAFLELTTPDVCLATAVGFPGGGRFEGAEAVREYIEEFTSNWDQVRYEHEGDRVVNGCVVHRARWVVRGETVPGGAAAEVFGVARFRGRLLASLELFWTEAEALDHARAMGPE